MEHINLSGVTIVEDPEIVKQLEKIINIKFSQLLAQYFD